MYELFLYLLVAQALLGAFDTIYHHELKVGLPQQLGARLELKIHAIRSVLYGILFVSLACFVWYGPWVWFIIGLIIIEVALTLWDFVVEDQSRLLPASERITHTILAINGSVAFTLLVLHFPDWYSKPAQIQFQYHGWTSWFLVISGVGVFVSGLRDAIAAWQTRRLDLQLDLDLNGHKRILMTGGTGFIGTVLCQEYLRAGHNITLISRRPIQASIKFAGKIRVIRHLKELSEHEKFDVVINLAGAPVVGPLWTKKRKQVLRQSRIETTKALVAYVRRSEAKPAVWIQASAIGFYGTDSSVSVNESSPRGQGFAAELCDDWENTTAELESLSIRRVILRFGLVFGRSGGSFPMMTLPFRFGLGSILGNGQQYLSWIHIEDLARLISFCIANNEIKGKFNAVAPDTVHYYQFAKLCGHLLQRPVWLTFPEKLLRLMLGEMASLFVDGPKIESKRLEKDKFRFRFPDLRTALMDLL